MGIYVVKDPGTLKYGIVDPSRSCEIVENFRRIDVKFMSPMTSDTVIMSLVIIESSPDFIYTQGPFKMVRSRKLPIPTKFPPEVHMISVVYIHSSIITNIMATDCENNLLSWISAVHDVATWMFGKYIA